MKLLGQVRAQPSCPHSSLSGLSLCHRFLSIKGVELGLCMTVRRGALPASGVKGVRGTEDQGERGGRQDRGTPSAGLSPSASRRTSLIIPHTFSPQALQLKTASDQVGAGQGSGEAQGWGLGP